MVFVSAALTQLSTLGIIGNAVAVPLQDVFILAAVALVVGVVHTVFQKEVVFVSFDRETAEAMGVNARLWSGVLYFTIGLSIPVAARAVGALPVFAFLTVPAAAALTASNRLNVAFVVSTVLGAVAAQRRVPGLVDSADSHRGDNSDHGRATVCRGDPA